MQCPRLDHYVRFHTDGTLTCCGHMVNAQRFNSLQEMQDSNWIQNLKKIFLDKIWPEECIRCKQTEELGQGSIRLNSIVFDKLQKRPDYLTVGGTLDNTCNSACQTCNSYLSTLIGKLDKTFFTVDNTNKFWSLPQEQIVHLDINGGEPSVSKNYQDVLDNLPANVRSIRVNTNCASVLKKLEHIAKTGVKVTVTVSLDGIGKIHNYVRWPIAWDKFYKNLMVYKSMPVTLNTWTTVSALNIGNFGDILDFVDTHKIDHSWALLQTPDPFNVRYKNNFTNVSVPGIIQDAVATGKNNEQELLDFIELQDSIRNISYKDYYEAL